MRDWKLIVMLAFFPLASFYCGLRFLWLLPGALIFLLSLWLVDKEKKDKDKRDRKYSDGMFYMEQLVVSFRKNRKILSSLENLTLFAEGELALAVKKAVRLLGSLEAKVDMDRNLGENMFREAFSAIEEYCGSLMMHNLHTFLIQVEEQGGDCEQALVLLGNQISVCKKEEKLYSMKMESVKSKLMLSCLLSCTICLGVMLMIPEWTDAKKSLLCRITVMVGICLLQGLFLAFYCIRDYGLTEACLALEETQERKPERPLRDSERKKLIDRYFPVWMYEVLLRLQTENISSCILHSIDGAHPVLAKPLYELYTGIEENPLSSAPYRSFLSEFGEEQIRSMMLQLFAVNAMGKEEIYKQIELLLVQNQALKELKDEQREESIISARGLLSALPMLVSFCVLIINMTCMLLSALSGFTMSANQL